MKPEDFSYVIESSRDFEETVISVIRAVEQKGWALFQVYDIKERLAAKGFPQEKLKIIEICSGRHAHNFLNKNRLISLCLPCKINVYEENGKVNIAGMKPTLISQLFPEISLEEARVVEKELEEMIDSAR